MKIILASNNRDKAREVREILAGSDVEVVLQGDAGFSIEAEETGTTFMQNAEIKARAALRASGMCAVADDSGLEINAMNGGPGVYSSRFCGDRSYNEACLDILRRIRGAEDRRADYLCAVVCVFPNGDMITAEGRIDGEISYEPRGTGGFGYDPIFIPEGFDRTMAELSEEEKNIISHRGRAFRRFAAKFREYMKN